MGFGSGHTRGSQWEFGGRSRMSTGHPNRDQRSLAQGGVSISESQSAAGSRALHHSPSPRLNAQSALDPTSRGASQSGDARGKKLSSPRNEY